MALADIRKPESINQAIAEFRRVGRTAFLKKYGFGPARQYFVVDDGERFDSKAIVGAAHGYEYPEVGPLRYDQFTGGASSVVPKLDALGFTVEHGEAAESFGELSALLEKDRVYTRDELRELAQTTDATLFTGIFRPAGFSSVLLFITKNKTPDRIQYEDRLEGDTLYFQSQKAGRKDQTLIDHKALGLELLLFYRDSKQEYPGAGFRYEGRFVYRSHTGAHPANFVLQREDSGLAAAAAAIERVGEFDPTSIEDARRKVAQAIVRRQGQPEFRRALMRAYDRRCAVTGCTVGDVLEAAHIVGYLGPKTNHVTNGLLLRADVHTLFDLKLITVDEQTTAVVVASALLGSEYATLHGKKLHVPKNPLERPSTAALKAHRVAANGRV